MRTICDVCEAAAAILFCPADEAALCQSCDDKVHMCNKLASRHVRVRLAAPSAVARCDICENAPAFFYCEVDGTSLCLQCDMIVHVGGKRTHGRYLILRQKVEFPGDKPGQLEDPASRPLDNGENNEGATNMTRDNQQNHGSSPMPIRDCNGDNNVERDTKMIDLNMKPQRIHEQPSNNQLDLDETWEESGTVQSTPRGPPILNPHLRKQPRTTVHIELGNRPDQRSVTSR